MDRDDIVPIPLRADFVARLHIPIDLTEVEADKIARVVKAYGKASNPTPMKDER